MFSKVSSFVSSVLNDITEIARTNQAEHMKIIRRYYPDYSFDHPLFYHQCILDVLIESTFGEEGYAKYRSIELSKQNKELYYSITMIIFRGFFTVFVLGIFLYFIVAFESIFFNSSRFFDMMTALLTLTEAEKEIAAVEDIFFAIGLLFYIYV
jgi:hypothetical protein